VFSVTQRNKFYLKRKLNFELEKGKFNNVRWTPLTVMRANVVSCEFFPKLFKDCLVLISLFRLLKTDSLWSKCVYRLRGFTNDEAAVRIHFDLFRFKSVRIKKLVLPRTRLLTSFMLENWSRGNHYFGLALQNELWVQSWNLLALNWCQVKVDKCIQYLTTEQLLPRLVLTVQTSMHTLNILWILPF
jgi:hypothetical protein